MEMVQMKFKGIDQLIAEMDRRDLVLEINSLKIPKNYVYFEKIFFAKNLLHSFKDASLIWVPREMNKAANVISLLDLYKDKKDEIIDSFHRYIVQDKYMLVDYVLPPHDKAGVNEKDQSKCRRGLPSTYDSLQPMFL
ncbi:hypothetical protein LOK49_LG12G02026 [Camellia lanceoleosa]|uniref:Uncharacterized protein n=1 Tax=Camellia lanceoleosa TaxID=1840588 RepID=A0ACC0FVE9_9ERIC|nr:hypothetical protein LOK49_LG12G02026 [Camellia lanceoleosa]